MLDHLTPDRWRRLKELFAEAECLEGGELSAFLSRECAGDDGLRAAIENLLARNKEAHSFLADPLVMPSAPSDVLSPGEVLSGQFVIERLLGLGGMGRVYLATDSKLRRRVAVKVMLAGLTNESELRQRFAREARAVAALKHPHICDLYQVGSHDNRDYLVLEYLEGTLLSERLHDGPLSMAEWQTVATEIGSALAYAHGKGVVHRDLKPSNIMLTEHGAKLLDFSLAKQLPLVRVSAAGPATTTGTMNTEQGMIVGTVSYMSPEQAEGKPIDTRSDIFSFGSVLYEMATGRRAFEGDSRISTLAAILRGQPLPLPQLAPLAPIELGKIIERCLEKRPQDRFQSMDDLLVAIDRLNSGPISVLSSPHGGMEPNRVRLRRLVQFGLAALAIILVAGLVFWLWPPGTAAPLPSAPPIAVTTYRGAEEYASLSPDGTQVAFSGNVEVLDNFDIYVKVIGVDPPLRLTHHPDPDTRPVWSPDGRWIAFERSGKLLLISPVGGPERIVARGEHLAACSWSSDSRSVIINMEPERGKPSGLFSVSVDTGIITRMVENANWPAVLSPDGHNLAYVTSTGGATRLYVAPVSTHLEVGKPRLIEWFNRGFILGCAWIGDKHHLVCSWRPDPPERANLWRIDIRKPTTAQLVPFTEGASGPTFSARGGRLVFDKYKDDLDTWRAPNPAGSEARSAPSRFGSLNRADSLPQYSPDRAKIAFVSRRSGKPQLWVAEADTSNARALTSEIGIQSVPQWSPDGKSILFAKDKKMYLIDADGGYARNLASEPGMNAYSPDFSPDGRSIYFSSDRSGRQEIWRMPSTGGPATQITKHGGSRPAPSLDGKFLVYTKPQEPGSGAWSIPVEGGEERQILKSRLLASLARSPIAPHGVFYMPFDRADSPCEINYVDLRTCASRRVLKIDSPRRFCNSQISVSPDGNWFLYQRFDFEDDLMAFDNFH